MTSRREGFGLEFPESLVVGPPVVASKVCGILEIFNSLYQEEQSSLVQPENDELPADAMLKKIMSWPESSRQHVTAAIVRRSLFFDAEKMIIRMGSV